jgi:hypothetical protein
MNRKTILLSSCGALLGLSVLMASGAAARASVRINDKGVFIQSTQSALNIYRPQQSIIYPAQPETFLRESVFWKAMPQRSPLPQVRAGSTQRSFQKQSAGIVLDRDRLQQPFTLTVSTEGSQVTGNIQINGKTIKSLQGQQTSLNIGSYLQPGTNNIIISGSSRAPQGTVRMELSGHGHHMSQRTSGNSRFMQSLTVLVH